jgi:hypothetical protein
MKSRDFTPLIMWFVLLAGIIVIAFIRLRRVAGVWDEYPVNFDTIFISSYVLWMIVELRVSKKDAKTDGKKISDFATCQLYGFGQAFTFLTALWFPSYWRVPNIAHLLGISIFLFGVCYRLWADISLVRMQKTALHSFALCGSIILGC